MHDKEEKVVTPPPSDKPSKEALIAAAQQELEAGGGSLTAAPKQDQAQPKPATNPPPQPTPPPPPASQPTAPPKVSPTKKQPDNQSSQSATEANADKPPQPAPAVQVGTGDVYMKVFFLTFFLGWFGADRFYLGYKQLGIIKLVTLGGFGLWLLADTIMLLLGLMKTAEGAPIPGRSQHLKTALITFISVLLFVLIVGLAILPSYFWSV